MILLILSGVVGVMSYYNLVSAKVDNVRLHRIVGAVGCCYLWIYFLWGLSYYQWWQPVLMLVMVSTIGGIVAGVLEHVTGGRWIGLLSVPLLLIIIILHLVY